MVNVPEENMDVGLLALIIAKEYDPKVEVERHLNELDDMTEEIERMLAERTKGIEKMIMSKTFLFEPGVWNDNYPFSYDLEDPLGKQLENQLLSTYLNSRKENCLSMPALFIALMERIDPILPFYAVRVPLHLFCRLYDRQTGDVWNIETTNGGHPARNQWYIESLGIPQVSIERITYLADMSKRELIADLPQPLMLRARRAEDYETALKYADLALRLNPHAIYSLVNKGAIYSQMGYEKLERIKSENRGVSQKEKQQLDWWDQEAGKYIERAFALG